MFVRPLSNRAAQDALTAEAHNVAVCQVLALESLPCEDGVGGRLKILQAWPTVYDIRGGSANHRLRQTARRPNGFDDTCRRSCHIHHQN